MPVFCSVPPSNLSTEDFGNLDYLVMKHAFDSQNELGRLANERIYQADVMERLTSAGIGVRREVEIVLSYQSFQKPLYLDLVVDERAVYEFKVVQAINEAHCGQLLTYLQLLDHRRGKVINFRSAKVESQFVNAPLTTAMRQSFNQTDSGYFGEKRFRDSVFGLLRDWGTSLSLLLYEEALVHLFGGKESVEVMMPLNRKGLHLGNQRFCLADTDTAFTLTAMTKSRSDYHSQLLRLIHLSSLKTIHWVNVGLREVALTSVRRD